MVVASAVDSLICPSSQGGLSSSMDALSLSRGNFRCIGGGFGSSSSSSSSGTLAGYFGDVAFYGARIVCRQSKLRSPFTDSWWEWRLTARVLSAFCQTQSRKYRRHRDLVVVDELGGQYEENFEDVKKQLLNYFTYKAVRTVLNQLYEMNPTQYKWFYDFVVTNKPGDGKVFIRRLVKEKQELAERVMITRLHLYNKWVKNYDHAKMYKEISDQNLELMRERLMETVKWPSDDTNTEKVG